MVCTGARSEKDSRNAVLRVVKELKKGGIIIIGKPDVKVVTYNERLTPQNAIEIFQNFDIVLDGSDNFPTKYLVNDACVLLKKPNVYGSIFRFEGQATVFAYEDGPRYRCPGGRWRNALGRPEAALKDLPLPILHVKISANMERQESPQRRYGRERLCPHCGIRVAQRPAPVSLAVGR
jgi:hypothetical protein